MLRTLTGVADLVLVAEEVQRDVKLLAGARSVVLDVYGEDSLGRRYDLEVSDPDEMRDPALAERARYLKRDPEGVSSMCKMMEDMREEAMQQGMKQGVQQGLLAALRNLMANTGSGVEASMDALGVPQDDRPRFRELLAGS